MPVMADFWGNERIPSAKTLGRIILVHTASHSTQQTLFFLLFPVSLFFLLFATSLFYAAPDSAEDEKKTQQTRGRGKRVAHFKIGLNNVTDYVGEYL